jgi:hypothetical protein
MAYFVQTSLNFLTYGYYITMFIAFFNICMNPFIYAAKYDEVKKRLRGWFVCNRVGQQDDTSLNTASLPIQNPATRTRVDKAFGAQPQFSATSVQSQCDKPKKIMTTKLVVQEFHGGPAVPGENECQPGTSQSALGPAVTD